MKKFISILVCLILVYSLAVASFADFGDFGGDVDFDYDYDYDYDNDYDNDYDYDYDDDDDYSPSYYYSYDGYPSGNNYYGSPDYYGITGSLVNAMLLSSAVQSDDSSGFMGLLMIAVIVLIIVIVRKRGKAAARVFRPSAPVYERPSLRPMSEYPSLDPGFSEAALREKISNLYVRFQNSWQAKDISDLRPFLTDSYYATVDRQLDSYRRNSQTNRVEKITVMGVSLKGFETVSDEDRIYARVNARIVDYVTDDKTGRVVRGSPTAEKFMEYEWILSRKSGTLTEAGSGTRVISCPNCGAPVDINKSAKCEYCDSIITVDSCDWVVSEIRGISQKTM